MKYIKLAAGALQTVFCITALVLVTRNRAIWFVTMLAGAIPPLLASYVLVLLLIACAVYMMVTSGAKRDMANYVLLFMSTATICCGICAASAYTTGPSIIDWLIVFGAVDFMVGVFGCIECWLLERRGRSENVKTRHFSERETDRTA